jgi:positive regulator of sigma E activity
MSDCGYRPSEENAMRDKGFVVGLEDDLALVEVECFIESCKGCAMGSLCLGQKQKQGILAAKNALHASTGDEVEIEIPDTKYNKFIILLFSSLLAASFLGLAAGYVFSRLLSLPSSVLGFAGLLLALIIAGVLFYRYFRKKGNIPLYPVITNIIKKRDGRI